MEGRKQKIFTKCVCVIQATFSCINNHEEVSYSMIIFFFFQIKTILASLILTEKDKQMEDGVNECVEKKNNGSWWKNEKKEMMDNDLKTWNFATKLWCQSVVDPIGTCPRKPRNYELDYKTRKLKEKTRRR